MPNRSVRFREKPPGIILGEGRTKFVAEAPGARRAGGQFCNEVGLDAPSVAVAPDRAEVGREIGREYDFGEERV